MSPVAPTLDSELAALVAEALRHDLPPLPPPWPVPGESHAAWAAGVAALREAHHRAAAARLAAAGQAPVPPIPVGAVADIAVPVAGDAIAARVYTPTGDGPFPALLSFHGGGFWLGGGPQGLDAADGACRMLCARLATVVVNVDYRAAPEHRFPVPLEDCVAATCWVAERSRDLGVDPARIAVSGASAGANLAAGVALACRDRGGPALHLQLLLVPALDATAASPSIATHGVGTDLEAWQVTRSWQLYLGPGGDPEDPRVSPLLAPDLSGVAPAHVVVAEFDPLHDEGVAYAERLRASGVPATCSSFPMTHALMTPAVAGEYLADVVAAVERANAAARA